MNLPWVIVFEVAPGVLAAAREVVPGPRLDDEDLDAAASQLESHDAPRRPGADNANLGVHPSTQASGRV